MAKIDDMDFFELQALIEKKLSEAKPEQELVWFEMLEVFNENEDEPLGETIICLRKLLEKISKLEQDPTSAELAISLLKEYYNEQD